MDMNRMTVKLQEALQSASALAVRRDTSRNIDVEHLLMALLEQDRGVASSLFEQAGVSPAAVRQAAEQALAKVPQVQGQAQLPAKYILPHD